MQNNHNSLALFVFSLPILILIMFTLLGAGPCSQAEPKTASTIIENPEPNETPDCNSPTVLIEQTQNDGTYFQNINNYNVAQHITPTQTLKVHSLEFYLANHVTNPSGTIYGRIWSHSSGSPSSAIISTQINSLSSTFSWVSFEFATPTTLYANANYSIGFLPSASVRMYTWGDPLEPDMDGLGIYKPGNIWWSPITWTNQGGDLMFRVNGCVN